MHSGHHFSPILIALLCISFSRTLAADAAPLDLPKAAQILSDLRPGHPRLIASTERFDQLKRDIQSDQTLARWHESLRKDGEAILPPARRSTRFPTACGCWRPAAACWIASRRWHCCSGWTATAATWNALGANWRRRPSSRTGTRGISWTRPK